MPSGDTKLGVSRSKDPSGSTSPWTEISPSGSLTKEASVEASQKSMDTHNDVKHLAEPEKDKANKGEKSFAAPEKSDAIQGTDEGPKEEKTLPETKALIENGGVNEKGESGRRSRRQHKKKTTAIFKASRKCSKHDMSSTSSSSESSDTTDHEITMKKYIKTKALNKAKSNRKTAKSKKVIDTEADTECETDSSEDVKSKRVAKQMSKAKKTGVQMKTAKVGHRHAAIQSSSSSSEVDSGNEKVVERAKPRIKETSVFDSFVASAFQRGPILTGIRMRDVTIEGTGAEAEDTEPAEVGGIAKPTTGEKIEKGSKAEFMRLDRTWSKDTRQHVTSPSSEDKTAGQYDGYAFNVVRQFDFSGKYSFTTLHILSLSLKKALAHAMGKVKGISLEEDTPKVDSDEVFLHLTDLRAYLAQLKVKIKHAKRKSKVKDLKRTKEHLKVLVKYINEDYDETKKSLEPLLKAGKITFKLAWALFKCNDIAYTSTYEYDEEPRAVQIEYISLTQSILEGDVYHAECRFVDHNGTRFGMNKSIVEIKAFQGARPITSLPIYPLKYHKKAESLKTELIERGKKFVGLQGMKYQFQKGMAFHKRDKKIIKVHVNGRVMLDPATFRRLRPNYPFGSVQPIEKDILSDSESDADIEDINESSTSSSDDASQSDPMKEVSRRKRAKQLKKWRETHKKKLIRVPADESDESDYYLCEEVDISQKKCDELRALSEKEDGDGIKSKEEKNDKGDGETKKDEGDKQPDFTDEEYLIASPVVVGFSFTEKLWLEFAVSGIHDIEWNEGAFDSLIIADDQKKVVKALVSSHASEEKNNIDDVIQGKGKGLVAVLHGPPGTGKTLTAEGIAELLKKPLYAVSVGELGIKGGDVERNLTQILDVAHTWGALLLLDEADVFLEQRENSDIGRNALVSIFLRMLEYFQGILFLTTNRVTVFDPAFASRIHIGLRYGALGVKAKKAVWRLFIDKVRALPGVEVDDFSAADYVRLGNFELNGREIKNAVRTAQSVALINKERLCMQHFLQVLLVGSAFAKDLKGAGYEEALKFYM